MVRIIAGRARGRRFDAPAGSATRPTADRVREAVFNAVVAWAGTTDEAADDALAGIAWLDLYAGSGAVSLEAASRGAGPVLAVEADRRTADGIGATAGKLGLSVTARAARAAAFLQQPPPQPFDVVWADPPYAVTDTDLGAELARLVEGGWLARTALVVLERSGRSAPAWPDGFGPTWDRRYGGTVVHYGHWDADAPAAATPAAATPAEATPNEAAPNDDDPNDEEPT